MSRTTTATGTVESGSALQRHAVRRIDNSLEHAIVAFSWKGVAHIAVEDGHVADVLDIATKFGATPKFGLEHGGYKHNTGEIALILTWD